MSLYNEDELVPPIWITNEFFERVLRQYEQNNSIKVNNVNICPASMKGDHSTTLLFRCKVTYTSANVKDFKQKSLILKTMPTEEGFKRDVLKETKLFETEIGLYTEALPKIKNILREYGENTKLAAEIVYYSLETHHKVIIFEDLSEFDYHILRNRYLNEDEIKLVYCKIAKLHASSYMLGLSEQHEYVTKFQQGIFSNCKILPIEFINQGINNFIQTLQKHKEFQVYKNKIISMQCDIIQGCKNLFNAYQSNNTKSEIFVLNHGDLYLKNLMFHYNSENQIDDVIMVDYQISCYAPSNVDLIFSQYLLLSPEMRLKRNELMFYYFEEFTRVLKKIMFKGKMPKYSDFLITGLKYRHYAVFLLSTFLPLVHAIWMLTPEELRQMDVDKFLDSPTMTTAAYDNPKYLKELKNLLPSLLYEGQYVRFVKNMSVYNEDELIAPSWIDEKFLESILQKYENNQSLKIVNYDISPASMKGDHYASIMFRCKTNYKIDGITDFKQKSLIIKTLPEVGMKAEMLQQSKVFETEIKMYTETLPKIEQILAQNGESTKLAANIIYHALEPRKVLIFDDLCELGYDILRTRYLTEEELKMIYRKVAKLHAVSFMLSQKEDHEIVTQYDEGIFSHSAIMSSDFMSKGILHFINLLAKHEEFTPYLDKVKLMQPKMSKQCQNLYNAFKLNGDERNIFVLNHGDFHLKNLMFKFNNENVAEDLIMVDYQLSCFAPINIDLIYSLYMMMRPEFRLRRNEFLYYYFEEFLRVLKKINYQGEMPKYSDFQMANLKYRYFVLFLISTLLPINHVVLSATEDELKEMNISEYIENSNATVTLYDHPGYINELKQLLPSLLVDGYFD